MNYFQLINVSFYLLSFFFLSGIFTEYETSRVASRIEIKSSLKKFTGLLKIRISIIFTNSINILSILKIRE